MKVPATGPVLETGRVYQPQGYASAKTRRGGAASRFDRFTTSAEDARSSFELQLRGRITQDVRTATSSGMVAAVREEIQEGSYTVDPYAIARKMLLMPEVD